MAAPSSVGPPSAPPDLPLPPLPPAPDVVVVGGGPAGSAAARLLALRGWSVVVLTGPPPRRPRHAESLPPGAWKVLDAVGVRGEVEGAGFPSSPGNRVAWGGRAEFRPFPGSVPGVQVERGVLDAILLDAAGRAGARVVAGAVRRVDPPEGGGDASFRVAWVGSGGSGTLRPRWLLDASGRAGVVARRGFRRRAPGPATTALLGVWRMPGRGRGDDGTTLVEAGPDGWSWSVPARGGVRYVAAMVDPRLSGVARGPDLQAAYREALANAPHTRALLEGAEPVGRLWATAATGYDARTYAAGRLLLLGDAGSFLDPLSSHGVRKALASGWLASVVVHTALVDPARAAPARALFQERSAAAWTAHARQVAGFHREAAESFPRPFWTARARIVPPDESSDAGEELPPDDLRWAPRMEAAFQRIRRSERLLLRTSPELRRIPRPTVQGAEVVLEEHLATPSHPRGVRHLRGVDLRTLLELSGRHQDLPDLFAAYARTTPSPVSLADFLGALSTLVGMGALEMAESS